MRILIFLVSISLSSFGFAATQQWNSDSNVNLDDGGTLAGGFLYDDSTDLFSLGTLTYNGTLGNVTFTDGSAISSTLGSINGQFALNLVFMDLLSATAAPGTTNQVAGGIVGTISFNGLSVATIVNDGATFSAVPIPAAAWLFGSGLIGLAGIARRKKATA